MMFDIIKVKTFQGDEFKVCGDDKVVHLEWCAPNHPWDILYFKEVQDDGVTMCMLHLAEELKLWATERKMDKLNDEFWFQAKALCMKVPHES